MTEHYRRVAELCGWKIRNPEVERDDYREWLPPGAPDVPNVTYGQKPPPYDTDLGAAHEAEREILGKYNLTCRYEHILGLVCKFAFDNKNHWSKSPVHATASQRTEALARLVHYGFIKDVNPANNLEHAVSTEEGPCGPKCPECGNSSGHGTPHGTPNFRCCGDCKLIFQV